MATIRRIKTGYRAEVARKGIRKSRTFPGKAAAKEWAAREEYLILNKPQASRLPFSEVLGRYAREVSSAKRGARWEAIRIERFLLEPFARKAIGDLLASDFAAWRDKRLRSVAPGSVRREMVLLSSVLNVAKREWGLITESPLTGVRKPAEPPHRDRLPTAAEMERLAVSAGDDLSTATARAYHAFLFSCETAMRAGEVVGLTWDRVDQARRVARLVETKNGTARDVPLSSEAVRLLEVLPRSEPVFGLTSRQLDALWRKLRDRAAVEGLTYHDSRHIAISRLAHKLDVLPLARMVGHKNIRQLMTYFNESAEDIAKKLD